MTEQPTYLDDRMFLLAVYPARLGKDKDENHQTVIFYDRMPDNPIWTVVTLQNVADYPIVGVNHFETEEQARAYKAGLEPSIPLASLGGRSPETPMSPDDYQAWKEERGLGDFDPDKAARLTGDDRAEMIVQTAEQFIAGMKQIAAVAGGAGRA